MSNEAISSLDRRSLYTKGLIKGSLLELLKTHSFTSISVTMLSETAGIGRNTFYRHFNNTFEALEAAIDDALEEIFSVFAHFGIGSEDDLGSYAAPFCEYVKSSDRYKIVFTDPDLASIIIDRMMALGNRRFVLHYQSNLHLGEKQAEALVRFQAAGILEICSTYAHASKEEWGGIVSAIDKLCNR